MIAVQVRHIGEPFAYLDRGGGYTNDSRRAFVFTMRYAAWCAAEIHCPRDGWSRVVELNDDGTVTVAAEHSHVEWQKRRAKVCGSALDGERH